MRILAVVSTIDFKYRMGTTPAWWGLLKALHEVGHTVTMIPYLGRPIETPWWKCLPNPCQTESVLYNWYLDRTGTRSVGQDGALSALSKLAINRYITPKWEKHLIQACEAERPDCVLFILVPLSHIAGIPTKLRRRFHIPVLMYDGDLPSSLSDAEKGLGSFKFAMYKDADISEYDCFLSPSKGIIPRLEELGAKRVEVMYYAADLSVFSPLKVEQDIDVFFYGHRNIGKERQFDYMVAEASRRLPDKKFIVGGTGHDYDLGNAEAVGRLSLGEWRHWCARSKINLNITKDTDSCIYASSSARPFELAAMGCCIVSDPYQGITEWFDVKAKYSAMGEVWMVNSHTVVEAYEQLLRYDFVRQAMGKSARNRVLDRHTYQHRARQLTGIIESL